MIDLVRMWYRTVKARVRVNEVESEWFETRVGVRQGDTLSPLLFNIFINGIVGRIKEGGGGVKIGDERVPILLFADDMVLMDESEEELKKLVDGVEDYCKEWHLGVNIDKTKVLVVSKDGGKKAKVELEQAELECVEKYPYLGTLFTADGRWEEEIDIRVQTGKVALNGISKQIVWNKQVRGGSEESPV